jgi:transcriptional regulator GlxA family with amidase domain
VAFKAPSLKFDGASVSVLQLARMPNAPRNTPRPRIVEILAFPDVQLLDVTGPLQVFASANDWARRVGKPAPYVARVVAQRTPVLSSSGLGLTTAVLPRASDEIDTLMVAGGTGVHMASEDAQLVRWVKQRATRARRVVSICTGAFLLGAAGLLHGRRVVTHWSECAELACQHPSTAVEVDPIFIRDGRVWTSAGVTAGIDLSLALLEEDLGHLAAISVARDLVVFLKRPGGQAQFSYMLTLQQSGSQFEDLHAWIAEHLAGDLTITTLSTKAAMSERTFVRRYRAATGLTPARAIEGMRVEAARQMLSESGVPIKRVAQRCGFGSEETMRRSFQRRFAIAPQEYRRRFAATKSS